MNQVPHIVILAAGQGKRMYSRTPKVLHPLLFRPMIQYVLELASSIPHQSLSMIVGHGEEEIRRECRAYEALRYFRQDRQLGTGHAVQMSEPYLRSQEGDVLILSGDVPLLSAASLKKLVERHVREDAACTLGTATLSRPHGYGRVLRQIDGMVADIREEADCSAAEKKINEVNAGIYCSKIAPLFDALARIGNRNAQNEYYLPDAVKALAADGGKVMPYCFGDPSEITGINNRYALWQAELVLQERFNRELMHRGVTLEDPRTTLIDPACEIEEDVRIGGGCVLIRSVVRAGAVLEGQCRIVSSTVGSGSVIKQGSYIEESVIGEDCDVGPYARLRPGSRLEGEVKIGNYVEVKKSFIGRGTKASHLSYIGDAEVGRSVNIGCGFITCNYDGGPEKRKTIIEDGAFIGSDSQTVAPVRVGAGSYVASGTTVTEDVPADSLAISRGRQTVKKDYAKKYRRTSPGHNRNLSTETGEGVRAA